MRTAVLTISTRVSRREAEDASGPLLAELAEGAGADVEATVDAATGTVTLVAEARTQAQTGVEMEALTAASVAALTVYDMVKGLEKGVEIAEVVLLRKTGGRSGDWQRTEGG